MVHTQETTMWQIVDSTMSYVLAVFVMGLATVVAYAPTIMTIGGLLLLLLRLYVDGQRAWHALTGKDM